MAGGKQFDDLVSAALKALQSGRPQAAVRSTIDDAIKSTGTAASAAKAALAKVTGRSKPKTATTTSKAAKVTSPKPSKTPTKEQGRSANQIKEAERRQKISDEAAVKKKATKAKNREKYLNKEKQKIDERYSQKTQREGGRPIIVKKVEKKLNAIEYKERLAKNEVGELDRRTDKLFKERMADIKADGYKLTNAEVKEVYNSIRKELKETGERNLDTMNANLREKMAKYKAMNAKEMDTEAGRELFRKNAFDSKTGTRPVDNRSRAEIARDKRLSDAAEEAAAKKADKARLSEKGTGAEKGPRPDKPFEESESGKRLQAAQKANAAKNVERKSLGSASSKRFTAEELRQTKIVSEAEAQAKVAAASKGGEGYNVKPSTPLRSGRRQETAEEINARLAAFRAKQSKGSKVPKKK